ncbi:MAG: hypothetical protein JWM77_773, partial [Rhodospirillales bacterium]|nr:hypothetical protein [Rhodospirillales bacterium]
MNPNGLTDEAWAVIEPLLPVPRKTNLAAQPISWRAVLDAALWVQATGRPWRAVPAEIGHWNSLHGRYRTGLTGALEGLRGQLEMLAIDEATRGLLRQALAIAPATNASVAGVTGHKPARPPANGSVRSATNASSPVQPATAPATSTPTRQRLRVARDAFRGGLVAGVAGELAGDNKRATGDGEEARLAEAFGRRTGKAVTGAVLDLVEGRASRRGAARKRRSAARPRAEAAGGGVVALLRLLIPYVPRWLVALFASLVLFGVAVDRGGQQFVDFLRWARAQWIEWTAIPPYWALGAAVLLVCAFFSIRHVQRRAPFRVRAELAEFARLSADAISHGDVDDWLDCFCFPAMLVETEGNHVFADRASLEDLLATRLDFYQAQGVAACVRRVRDARLFAPDLAQLRVHDTLRQADGDAIVAW